jgi:hypothetical protein
MIGSKKRTDMAMIGSKKRGGYLVGTKQRPSNASSPVFQNGLLAIPKSVLEKK